MFLVSYSMFLIFFFYQFLTHFVRKKVNAFLHFLRGRFPSFRFFYKYFAPLVPVPFSY